MLLLPIIGLATATRPLAAQVVASDSSATLERVADGVYAIIHASATENWPHGNTGVIVGDDGVLVIDSDYYPSRARADIALIRRVTTEPVRYLINTHWHGDHTHGNETYRDEFPSLAIVSASANRDLIALNQLKWPRTATSPHSATRAALAAFEATLAAGRDSAGRPLSAVEHDVLARNVRERRTELEELSRVSVVPPNVVFGDSLVIFLGKRRIELRNWGRAHSPADVTVYVPAERILFTGDIVVSPLPYVWGSYPGPWIDVLRRLEALPVAIVVPGHGEVLHDLGYVHTVRELFEAAQIRIDSLFRLGKTAVEVPSLLDLTDLRPMFRRAAEGPSDEEWDEMVPELLARMAQCVNGYRC